ncbi:MAG: ABC transporter permease [Desulfobacterales bacterium]|nr:MAG: ABC transporter permease [Desulfobacterales bacterium]
MAPSRGTPHAMGGVIERISSNPRFVLGLQLGPLLFWIVFFLFIPLLLIVFYSFCLRGLGGTIEYTFSLKNYIHFFTTPIYRKILVKSIVIAIEVTLGTLLVAYIPAYFIATTKTKNRLLLLILMIVPFWTSLLIRNYSWILILGREGIINVYLMKWGIISQPLELLYTEFAVVLGLVHWVLPFMVFPLFSTIDNIDFNLVDAAKNLGANDLQAFWRVTLPLSMPGIAAGCLLVFILTVGSFVTPSLLGGPEDLMITMVITQRFLTLFDWPFGSAASIIYLMLMILFILVYDRFIGLKRILKM